MADHQWCWRIGNSEIPIIPKGVRLFGWLVVSCWFVIGSEKWLMTSTMYSVINNWYVVKKAM